MPDAVSWSVYGVPVSLIALVLWKSYTLKQLIFLSFLLPASVLCVSALVVYGSRRIARQQSQAASRAKDHVPAPRLKWATPASFHSISLKYEWERTQSENRPPLHSTFSQPVNAAIDQFLSHITNNFVLSWWSPLTSSDASPAFPNAIDGIIRHSVSSILIRAQHVDWPSLLVAQVLPQLTTHMTRLKQAGGLSAASQTTDQALDLLLSQKYASLLDEPGKPGKLHPAINVASAHTRPSEEAYLRSLFDDILPMLLPEADAQSAVVLKMAREIIVSSVLVPLVESISEPDFWNVLIDTKIQAAINEREQVAALRAALDRVPPSPVKKHKSSQEISSATSNKEFESFLRSIRRCTSLVEARRLRNDILLSIRRARRSSGSSEPSEEQKSHLDRLESALRYNDQRISDLGGGSVSPSTPAEPTFANTSSEVSLLTILHDSAALTFWMEFMERRRRLALVQFWLTVEGLRDPLDDQDADLNRPEASKAAKEDADLLYSSFFTSTNATLLSSCCSVRNVTVLRNFAEEPVGRTLNVGELRAAIHALQNEVLEEIDGRDMPAFRSSDLCIKMTNTLYDGANAVSPTHPTARALSGSQRARPVPVAAPASFFSATASAAGAIPSIFHPSKLGFLGRSDSAPPRVTATEAVVSSPTAPKTEYQALFGTEQPQPSASKSSEQSSPRGSSSDPANFALLMGLGDEEGVERAPLFAGDGRTSLPQTPRPGIDTSVPESEADDLTNVQKMQALQEALSGIIEGSDTEKPQVRPKLNRTPSEQSQASIELQRAASVVHLSPDIGLKARSGRPSSTRRASSSPQSSRTTSRRQSTDIRSGEVSSGSTELTATPSHPGHAESSTSESVRKRIEDLTDQEEVILQLLRSKGLSENRREQKILQSSLEAVRVEKRTLNFRLSEKNNTLVTFGKTSVCIPSTTSGGTEGKDFVLYLVSLQQTESAGASSGWFVPRRYSEFFDLHTTLRDKFIVVRSFDFPSKRLVTSLSSSLVEHRRVSLERYLKSLMQVPEICNSVEVQTFLSHSNLAMRSMESSGPEAMIPGQGLLRNIYRSLAVGFDELTAGPTMFETMAQRLTHQASELARLGLTAAQQEDLMNSINADPAAPLAKMASLSEGITSFTAPICDLFIEMFELKDRSQWLRRQAVLVVLQQVLGGTIERKLREGVTQARSEGSLVHLLSALDSNLFPDGRFRASGPARTIEDKEASRQSASRRLAAFLPELTANVMGRRSARIASHTVFALLQSKRLLKHLIYMLVDTFLREIFADPSKRPLTHDQQRTGSTEPQT